MGLGYAVRAGIAIYVSGLAIFSTYGQATIWAIAVFGVMFVLLIWTLDGSSHCDGDLLGPKWELPATLRASKPQISELLAFTARPPVFVNTELPTNKSGATQPVLRRRGKIIAPWNVAGLAAAVSLTWVAIEVPGRSQLNAETQIFAYLIVLLLFVAVAACDRTSHRFYVLASASVAGALAALMDLENLRIIIPLVVVGLSYTALRHTTYREFQLGPATALSHLRSLAQAMARRFVGERTWQKLT